MRSRWSGHDAGCHYTPSRGERDKGSETDQWSWSRRYAVSGIPRELARDRRAPPDEISLTRQSQTERSGPKTMRPNRWVRARGADLFSIMLTSVAGMWREGVHSVRRASLPGLGRGAAMLNPVTSALAVIEPENLIWSAMIGMSGDCWPKPLPPLTLTVCVAV